MGRYYGKIWEDMAGGLLWQVTLWESEASLRRMLRCSAWVFLRDFTAGKVGGDRYKYLQMRHELSFETVCVCVRVILVDYQIGSAQQLKFLTLFHSAQLESLATHGPEMITQLCRLGPAGTRWVPCPMAPN